MEVADGSITSVAGLNHGAEAYREWFISFYWACESGDKQSILAAHLLVA